MNFKRVMAGSLMGAGMLASPSVFAGATGNVGAFSEYMFRGISQGSGAAVQGGLDYAHDSGFYAGTWVSTIGFAGATANGFTSSSSSETDFYAGFTTKLGEVGLDIGAIYYWYPEEDETGIDFSTVEVYAGASFGPVALKYYYSDEANFFGLDGTVTPVPGDTGSVEDAGYLLGTLALPITDSLSFTSTIGFYSGDEIERLLAIKGSTDDSYTDYSVGLAKTLDGGMTFTLVLADTDITDIEVGGASGIDDEPRVVVGFKKTFDL